jgi:glutamate N-acetyltransferase/amino-acid N-acetyltransferase
LRVPSTNLSFETRDAHRAWLAAQAALPAGFRVGCTRFEFMPKEAPKPAKMTLTLLALDEPTTSFAAMFTRNAFPGAPIIVGRKRLAEASVGAVIINNKISNVCAPGGVEASEQICAATAQALGLSPTQVLPSSTGVIGWSLPTDTMVGALPAAVGALRAGSILPAAEGIVTTDLYPKIRRATVGGGSIVGIAKGAGMIEPNMATLIAMVFTDAQVESQKLNDIFRGVINKTLNCVSVDTDTSTSDTAIVLASGAAGTVDDAALTEALHIVLLDLTKAIARDGEGAETLIEVVVDNARDAEQAKTVAKSIVNSPLVKTAVHGADPNWGRVAMAVGKCSQYTDIDQEKVVIRFGTQEVYPTRVDESGLAQLSQYMRGDDVTIHVSLQTGSATATVWGCDLTDGYVRINADYTT